MIRRILLPAAAFAMLSAAGAMPAQASLFCEVVKTRDGFVALRASPDASAKMLARVKGGSEVFLAGEKRNGWEKVKYWPAGDRLTKGEAARTMTGWINGKLVDLCG